MLLNNIKFFYYIEKNYLLEAKLVWREHTLRLEHSRLSSEFWNESENYSGVFDYDLRASRVPSYSYRYGCFVDEFGSDTDCIASELIASNICIMANRLPEELGKPANTRHIEFKNFLPNIFRKLNEYQKYFFQFGFNVRDFFLLYKFEEDYYYLISKGLGTKLKKKRVYKKKRYRRTPQELKICSQALIACMKTAGISRSSEYIRLKEKYGIHLWPSYRRLKKHEWSISKDGNGGIIDIDEYKGYLKKNGVKFKKSFLRDIKFRISTKTYHTVGSDPYDNLQRYRRTDDEGSIMRSSVIIFNSHLFEWKRVFFLIFNVCSLNLFFEEIDSCFNFFNNLSNNFLITNSDIFFKLWSILCGIGFLYTRGTIRNRFRCSYFFRRLSTTSRFNFCHIPLNSCHIPLHFLANKIFYIIIYNIVNKYYNGISDFNIYFHKFFKFLNLFYSNNRELSIKVQIANHFNLFFFYTNIRIKEIQLKFSTNKFMLRKLKLIATRDIVNFYFRFNVVYLSYIFLRCGIHIGLNYGINIFADMVGFVNYVDYWDFSFLTPYLFIVDNCNSYYLMFNYSYNVFNDYLKEFIFISFCKFSDFSLDVNSLKYKRQYRYRRKIRLQNNYSLNFFQMYISKFDSIILYLRMTSVFLILFKLPRKFRKFFSKVSSSNCYKFFSIKLVHNFLPLQNKFFLLYRLWSHDEREFWLGILKCKRIFNKLGYYYYYIWRSMMFYWNPYNKLQLLFESHLKYLEFLKLEMRSYTNSLKFWIAYAVQVFSNILNENRYYSLFFWNDYYRLFQVADNHWDTFSFQYDSYLRDLLPFLYFFDYFFSLFSFLARRYIHIWNRMYKIKERDWDLSTAQVHFLGNIFHFNYYGHPKRYLKKLRYFLFREVNLKKLRLLNFNFFKLFIKLNKIYSFYNFFINIFSLNLYDFGSSILAWDYLLKVPFSKIYTWKVYSYRYIVVYSPKLIKLDKNYSCNSLLVNIKSNLCFFLSFRKSFNFIKRSFNIISCFDLELILSRMQFRKKRSFLYIFEHRQDNFIWYAAFGYIKKNTKLLDLDEYLSDNLRIKKKMVVILSLFNEFWFEFLDLYSHNVRYMWTGYKHKVHKKILYLSDLNYDKLRTTLLREFVNDLYYNKVTLSDPDIVSWIKKKASDYSKRKECLGY